MKLTIDKDVLAGILADVAKVCIAPYHEFVVQLAKEERIETEELDQLLEKLRGQTERVTEIVVKGLYPDSR